MDTDLIKAHLNLYAVLQNLEDLVRLDDEMARLTRDWNVVIQFTVRGGPVAHVGFANGVCTHGVGPHPNPSVKLLFLSAGHLNRMFDGKGTPIPLKGFTRLGFLQKEFSKLTDRLTYYLKPANGAMADPRFLKVNTILTLHTAAYAVKELALLEPTSREIAAHTPAGVLQMEVLPDGPCVTLSFGKDAVAVQKARAGTPMAKMSFKDLRVANALLGGKLDVFLAVAEGDIMLQGQLPMIDNVGLILDRVGIYLT